MDRQIIINADDFGLCTGVNRAVAQAHTNGVLTSATVMTNMPAAEQALKIARQLPRLGVGVHLNLTEGSPLSKLTHTCTLVNSSGKFSCTTNQLALFCLTSAKFRNAVKAELAAQIQWAIDRDLHPTHLDSHKHFHCFPAIYTLVCDLARQFAIPAIRFTYEPKSFSNMSCLQPHGEGKKKAALTRLMARLNRLQNPHFFKTDALLGIAHTGKINASFFQAVTLYNKLTVAEIMTHPGFKNGLEKFKTRLLQQRENELEALCSEKTRCYLKNARVKLVHYGQL